MTSKSSLIFLIVFLFLGCAKQEHKRYSRHSKNRVFSKETELSFEMIERNRALEYYRQLRVKAKKRRSPKKIIRKYSRPKPRIRKPIRKAVRKEAPRFRKVNIEEQEQELLQRMSYFCMQKRKQKRFIENRGGLNCSDFTQNIMANCQVKFPVGTRELTNCVKRSMH